MSMYVTCRVCGGEFLYINQKHLETHGMTTADYSKEFPWAPFQSEYYIETRIEPIRGVPHEPERVAHRAELHRQWWASEAAKPLREFLTEHPFYKFLGGEDE